ncbi:MAG: hypothetical protein AB7L66_04135 [Gemmatimonadales bacterium]
MVDTASLLAWAEARLDSLPSVVKRPEFGGQAYLVGGTRFAAVSDRSLVMHLPPADLIRALRRGAARPFVSVGAMGRNGWVEILLPRADEALLEALIAASHSAAQHAHRRSLPRRPAAARRQRNTPTKR